MIIGEREPLSVKVFDVNNRVINIEQFAEDGRLTEESDGKVYRIREAYLLSRRLGRPLTDEEMLQFEVKEDND